jgi:hypothetical protein
MLGRFVAPPRRATSFAAVACAAALLSAAGARGQADSVLPSSGMDSLLAEHRQRKDLANDLLRGARPFDPGQPSHLQALDTQAKYVTYQFTWVPVSSPESKPGEIDKVYAGGIERDVTALKKGRPATAGAIQVYSGKVIEHAGEVLQTPKLIAKVNAARVLAKLAELGPPELADPLVAVLESQESDAVKYWALRGLRVLAAQQPPVLNPERDKKAAEALAAFIERRMTITDTTKPEEVEGFRVVRREAIRALAQIRNPAAAAGGRGPMALLRVVAKDGLVPPPRMDERVAAAIGIARLKPALDKEYNQDYALAQVGLFLDDYTQAVTRDRNEIVDSKAPQLYPWKGFALEMYEAVEQLRAEATEPYVTRLADECLALLDRIEKGNPADPERILRIVLNDPPKSGRLFKNLEDSTVRPANRRDSDSGVPLPVRRLQAQPPKK